MIFPNNARKIIFQHDFLERPSFQDVWKKKIWFSVQCKKEIETINSGENIEYRKDLKKIRFESNDDLH